MSESSKPEPQDVSSDGEEHVPMHDITATTVSGARVRRSTQKFTVAEPKADDTDEFKPPVGAGDKVKDIPGVCDTVAALNKKHGETLKALYMVMYARRFQLKNIKVIKEHILEFSGVAETDDKAREVLVGKIARWKRSFVQEIMDVLGVDRSKKSFDDEEKQFDKDALIQRLVDWLHHPQEKKGGRKASTPKSATKKPKTEKAKPKAPVKRKSTGKDASTTKKQKTAATTATKRKASVTAASAPDDENDENDNESEDEDAASNGDESGSDYDDDAKATTTKKKTAKAMRKASIAKKPAATAKDAETDAPSVALAADVKAKVKQIIEQGNAEELTVKKIVRQVSEELGRDLSAEKNAIKEFIKAGQ